jgi:hypothetical protein
VFPALPHRLLFHRLSLVLLSFVLLLSGCSRQSADVAPASLFELSGDVTSAGVQPGDDPETFIKAYKNYTIQVAYNDVASSYLTMSIDEIPYDRPISAMIANFFIDDEPVSEDTLCKQNDVSPSELYSLLSSTAYLQQHDVIYRYLRFQWTNRLH